MSSFVRTRRTSPNARPTSKGASFLMNAASTHLLLGYNYCVPLFGELQSETLPVSAFSVFSASFGLYLHSNGPFMVAPIYIPLTTCLCWSQTKRNDVDCYFGWRNIFLFSGVFFQFFCEGNGMVNRSRPFWLFLMRCVIDPTKDFFLHNPWKMVEG